MEGQDQESERSSVDGGRGEADEVEADKDVKPAAGAISAEERCPICLEDFQDKAFVDACFHTFCFSCVVRWAETTTTSCPMCKTVFSKVIHNVRANDDYDVFKVVHKPSSSSASVEVIDLEAALRSFRGYRTTRLPGQPSRSQPSTSNTSVLRPRLSRYGRGVRKRRSDSRKPASTQRRRAVYSSGVRALPLSSERSGARPLKIRDITASFFCSNPAATHRLYPWLGRELEVLVGEEHVQFVIQLIMSLIDKVDLQSEEFPAHLEPYLNERTAHFMHEFTSFASSPYDMIAYDQNVAYNWPASHPENVSRETGEATQGPSSDIQQRILDELTSTSWDDSPPILETTSPSYLDHSSDSDFAGEGRGTENTTTHVTAVTEVVDDRDVIVIKDERTTETQEMENFSDQRVNEKSTPSVEVVDRATALSHSQGVSTNSVGPDLQARTQEVKEESTVVDLTNAPDSQLQGQSSSLDPAKEEFEIHLFAEDESVGGEYDELARERAPKQETVGCNSKKTRDNSSKDSQRRKRENDSRNDESSTGHRNQERRLSYKSRHKVDTRERSRSRDRSSSKHYREKHEYSRHDSRSHKSSKHRNKHRHSPPIERGYPHRRDVDDREARYDGDSSYYWRSKSHRSKLYSDDLSSDDESQTQDRLHGRGQRSNSSRLMHAKRSRTGDSSTGEESHQALHQELHVLEKEINENKRDLLKSMLRRERIELLRKSLYPQDCTNQLTPLTVETHQHSSTSEAGVGDMQNELKSLEVAILDGKKHLLKVMKKIEEDQVEQECDSN